MGVPARAAVVNSGVSDAAGYRERADAAEMDALMRATVPNFDAEKKPDSRAGRGALG